MGLDANDREDIKQEVLIRLYHKLATFKTDMRFRTWLWTLTRNVVIDWARKEWGRRRPSKQNEAAGKPQLVQVPLTPAMEESLASGNDAPDEQLIKAHNEHMLRHVMAKVKVEMKSSRKWDCFEMHYLQGTPSREVAEKLGLSIELVNTNTSRVRARIREWWQYYDIEL